MAGPSIVVRVFGDLKALASSFSDGAKTAQSGAAGIKSAFSSVLGQLNQAGVLGPFGDQIQSVSNALDGVAKKGGSFSTKLLGTGSALTAVGLAFTAMGASGKQATQQLDAAITNSGHNAGTYKDRIDAAVKSQEKFGNTAVQTKGALQILTQATGDPAKALQYLGTASDLAAAKHEDLTTAAGQLGKAYNGAGRILKDFGITALPKAAAAQKALTSATKEAVSADSGLATAKQKLSDLQAIDATKGPLTLQQQFALRDAQKAVTDATDKATSAHAKVRAAQDLAATASKSQGKTLDELGAKLKGQAAAGADSFTGKMRDLRAKVTDAAESFGQKFGPALAGAGAAMTGLATVGKIARGVKDFAEGEKVAAAATRIATTAQWLLNVAMDANPVVLIALAIVGLVAIIVLLAIKFKAVRVVIEDVAKFIKTVAVDAFHGLDAAVKAVWNWIKQNWMLIVGFFLGPIALIAAAFLKWHDQIIGFFTKLPGEILKALGALGKLLEQAGKDLLQGLWNGIQFIWNTVGPWLAGLAVRILTTIGSLLGTLLGAGRDLLQGLWNGIVNIWTTVSGWLAGTAGRIVGAVGDLLGTLFNAGWNLIKGFWNGIGNIWSAVWGWLSGLGDRALHAIPEMAGFLVHAGEQLIHGFINGIKNVGGDIGGAIVDVVKNGASGLLHFLHITSPSKLFMGYGQQTMQGYADGLSSMSDTVASAMTNAIPTPASVAGAFGVPSVPGAAGPGAAILGGGRSGPAVVVQTANFNSDIDVDSFMRRVAWVSSTRGM
jgi:hypothetical protein